MTTHYRKQVLIPYDKFQRLIQKQENVNRSDMSTSSKLQMKETIHHDEPLFPPSKKIDNLVDFFSKSHKVPVCTYI